MQRAILLGMFLAAALGTTGAQRVTVQQLEQFLASSGPLQPAADGAIGETDLLDQINREDSLAPRLAELELTQRLTGSARAHLVAQYKLGPLTASALELLADRSAWLDPPASEIPDLPVPGAEAQKTMVRQASQFVFQTLTHLPNFFALLTTTQFDDAPVVIGGQSVAEHPGLRRVGGSQREISFSDGKEVLDSARVSLASKPARDEGLESHGEFGAEAAIVFLDLVHGTIAFHHWERAFSGPVAVFRYTVPRAASHYEVNYSCKGQPSFHAQPGYHGSLSIDLATGVLVRFTVLAETSEDDPISQVASAIEYGPVVLGDRRHFCPVRSLAFTVEEADACRNSRKRRLTRPVTMLNRVVFSDYHRLGSEMVIVPGTQPGKTGAAPAGPDLTVPPPAQTSPAGPRIPPTR